MSSTTSSERAAFRRTVWRFYQINGRHTLPWRQTRDPYAILVSEVMLQQTQVDRVLPKYERFLNCFPDVQSLASAPLSEVLILWQGLGYNRRARYLQRAAQQIVQSGAPFPSDCVSLYELPGIGAYTAAAVSVFAYDARHALIETNIRTVFLYHFFKEKTQISDQEIIAMVAETLPRQRVREWYYALMDYGSYLKRTSGNENQRSRHYKKQSIFQGSNRQLRGILIKSLLSGPRTKKALDCLVTGYTAQDVDRVLTQLCAEGLVEQSGHDGYRIAT